MRFTAFDFETCNGHNLSAVELGIAVYEYQERWRLVESRCWRFYPIDDEFWNRCSRIHGIYRHHVEGLPTFADRWSDIEPYFRNTSLVAHNAPFDVRVLCSHLDHHGLNRPDSWAQCTMSLGAEFIQGCGGKLSDFCYQLRIPLQHHNALSDAVATGQFYTRLHERHCHDARWNQQLIPLQEWSTGSRRLPDDFDQYSDVEWQEDGDGQLQEFGERSQSQSLADKLQEKAERCFQILDKCTSPILEGWAFSITGDMLIERDDFVELVRRLGAQCGNRGEFYGTAKNPHGPTNALLISDQELRDIIEGKPATKKLRDAITAREKGKSMVILPEEHFYETVIDWREKSLVCISREEFQEWPVTDHIWTAVALQISNRE